MSSNIVWVASYPKSGNTWFRVFIGNILSEFDTPVNINELSNIPISSSRSLFDDYIGTNSSDLTNEEISELRPLLYKRVSESVNDLSFIKTHDSWGLNTKNKEIFPPEITYGVVYIIRNPLDVAISYSYHNSEPIELTIQKMNNMDFSLCANSEKLSNQLTQKLMSWSEHVKSWIDYSNLPVHVIRYEDMLKKPNEAFGEVIQFLKIKTSQERIKKAIKNSAFDVLKSQENQYGFKEKPIRAEGFFRSGKINNWKNHEKKHLLESLIDNNLDIMKRFGYLAENL